MKPEVVDQQAAPCYCDLCRTRAAQATHPNQTVKRLVPRLDLLTGLATRILFPADATNDA